MYKYRLPRAAFNAMQQDMQGVKLGCDGPQAVVYKTAWLDYVKAVWSDIVDQLEGSSAVAVKESKESDG